MKRRRACITGLAPRHTQSKAAFSFVDHGGRGLPPGESGRFCAVVRSTEGAILQRRETQSKSKVRLRMIKDCQMCTNLPAGTLRSCNMLDVVSKLQLLRRSGDQQAARCRMGEVRHSAAAQTQCHDSDDCM